MSKQINIGGILLIILTIALLFVIGYTRINPSNPKTAYIVYLGGKNIGLIEDKDDLYNIIDKEQESIKSTFGVDKVYPPDDLETVEYTTYSQKIKTAEEIYDIIEEKSTFTIKGYTVTIKPTDGEAIYINILNKDDLEPALTDAVSAFVDIDELNAYIKDNQIEITDTGKTLKNVYFEEKITIKENYLSVDDTIILNRDDLTKYLLFGTLEPQKEYIVNEGDTVENVAFNNELSNEELLIANPTLGSVNALLSPGQILNIGLIAPLFTVVEESEEIVDIQTDFQTITEKSDTMYVTETNVKQEGSKGTSRITEQIQYKNGEIVNLIITSSKELVAPVDKIIVKGTRPVYSFIGVPPAASSTDWGWPTISPYVITSDFGYRWGKLHGAIDISGTGTGSPIFSATDGVVIKTYNGCSNYGSYGSSCGGGMGNYVEIQSSSGYIIYYAHMRTDLKVSVGDTVTKGQRIGSMGSSGSSTGTHLHFEIRDEAGNKYDPCKVAFEC